MKRTELKRRTPLKPSGTLKRSWPLASRKTAIRRKVKKVTVAEGAKYLAACKGEPCFARIAGVCCGDLSTVVPAHSNQARHGKGMGRKADHIFTVPMCFTCHQWTDQGPASREDKFALWDDAYAEWEPVRARKMNLEVTQPEMESA